jgi:hypothetical protein
MVLDHWFWFQLRRFFMIRLRVVGVFYDETFTSAEVQSIKNIKDLLDAAVKRAGMVTPVGGGSPLSKFTYTSTIRDKPAATKAVYSLLGFTHYLTGNIEPSLGDKKRSAGYYKLFESTSVERDSVTVHAWQYYVIRKDKANSNSKTVASNFWEGDAMFPDVSPAEPNRTTNGLPGFTPFDQMLLEDGDEVIWRNVSIVRNPQTEPIY